MDLIKMTKGELSDLISSAVTQAMSERRASDIIPHLCFCADSLERRKHQEEHEALRRLVAVFERIENAKWKLWIVVFGLVATAVCYAAWEGFKGYLLKGA